MTPTFHTRALRFPPILVRLLARKNGKAMTDRQIQIATGGSRVCQFVLNMRDPTTWDDVSYGGMRDFTRACNMDFENSKDMNRAESYLKKRGGNPKFEYLTGHPDWQTVFYPMIVSWAKTANPIPEELPEPIKRLLRGLAKEIKK